MADSAIAEAKALHIPSAYGESPKGWTWSRLDEVSEGVFDCPHSTPELTEVGPYVVRTQDIITGVFRADQAGHVSEETYAERIVRVAPSHGDLLYSREGTYFGIAAEVPAESHVCLGQRMVLIRPDKRRLDFSFLRYWLNSPIMAAHIHGYRDGSVAERLNLPTIRALPVLVPPLVDQKAIAAVLGALDDKIELNRRMNATLEAMARALFQSWFVDFDPVRAKIDGHQPIGLDKATAALFPAGFQDSEAGQIPKGWEVRRLSELCTLGRGASPRPINDYMNGEVPWVKIADATGAGGPFLFETKEKVKKAGAEKSVPVAPGDLILSNSATCGVPVFVELHGCIHDGWLYFKNLRSISKIYLFHVLIELAEHLVHIADGSVQKNLNTSLVGQQSVLVPPQVVVDAFDAQATVWFAKMRQNGLESRTLATLRDTSLPKLLSGELRVSTKS